MNETHLSPNGWDRRQQIKDDCVRQVSAMRRWQQRKRALLPSTVAAVSLAVLVAVVWQTATGPDIANRTGEPGIEKVSPAEPANAIVVDSPNRTVRPAVHIETIDNERLLELLAEAGRPSSIGRIDGKLIVLPANQSF
jgi:hypothetical protein